MQATLVKLLIWLMISLVSSTPHFESTLPAEYIADHSVDTTKRVHPEVLEASGNAMVQAYPDYLDRYENGRIYFKDGTYFGWNPPISSGHFHALMRHGRLYMQSFWGKVYGDTEGEVVKDLGKVKWLKKNSPRYLSFTKKNGAADALQKVSDELDDMPEYKKYLTPLGGTFNWRKVRGGKRQSPHSYGIAIDINTTYANYWRWDPEFKKGEPMKFRNRIPMEVVEVFERNGFVWGGRWPHYDTMHFEYRPEVKIYNDWFENSRFNRKKAKT